MRKKIVDCIGDGIQLPLGLGKSGVGHLEISFHAVGLHIVIEDNEHGRHKNEDNGQVKQKGPAIDFQMQKVRQF